MRRHSRRWQIIIDDDSGEDQDVALVVRRPFTVRGFDANLDADDQHFLFPNNQDNQFFPDRRDVLFAEIQPPGGAGTFFVLVVHAKSRFEGRATTDFRREEAARRLIQALEQRFAEESTIDPAAKPAHVSGGIVPPALALQIPPYGRVPPDAVFESADGGTGRA